MTPEKMELISKVISDEAALKELTSTDTPAAAVAFFAARGVEVTEADVAELAAAFASQANQDELSEESLENVSGGVITLPLAFWVLKGFSTSVAKNILVIASRWGVRYAEKKFGKDLNGDGKIG